MFARILVAIVSIGYKIISAIQAPKELIRASLKGEKEEEDGGEVDMNYDKNIKRYILFEVDIKEKKNNKKQKVDPKIKCFYFFLDIY